TDRMEAQVLATLALSSAPPPPVVRVSSRTGEGIEKLWDLLSSVPLRRARHADLETLLQAAHDALAQRFHAATGSDDPRLRFIVQRWQQSALDLQGAGAAVLEALAAPPRPTPEKTAD